jgi:PhnB protein
MPDMQITSYLTFNGDCKEAMTFYQMCLGGALTFQSIGESPLADKIPAGMKGKILHATLIKEGILLMGSDMVGKKGLTTGTAVSLMLNCNSEKEIKDVYEKLSVGGEKNHPLEITFFGALLGDITDRYGHHWLLHYGVNNNQQVS